MGNALTISAHGRPRPSGPETGTGRRVALSFDFDALSYWIGSVRDASLGVVSQGEFSAVGVGRVLAVLARHAVPATFFVSGHTALAYPREVAAIHAGGHEIGHHGFVHEEMSVLSPSQQRMVMAEGLDVLERVTGDRPVGFRAPSGQFTDATPSLLRDFGVTYDSSLLGDDVQAHWLRDGDRHPTFGPYTFGRDLDIVELPWGRVMSDVPHFGHGPGADGSGTASATQVHDIWWEEFDYFRRHGEGGCLQFVLHPGLIGRGPRIEMLDRLIGAMTRRGAVFTTLRDAAEHARCSLPSGR